MDITTFSLGLFVGMVLGISIMSVGFMWMLKRGKQHKSFIPEGVSRRDALTALTLGALMLAFNRTMPIHAQETPVPLVIPINEIFTQANNWLSTLSPIASLGIGIIIALAVFGFLSKAIKSAFG